jgi:gluconate 2-dehydrogenase gamma chain
MASPNPETASSLLTRREAIQRAALLLGFAISPAVLTGVMRAQGVDSTERLKSTYLDPRQLGLTGSIIDRILPRTDTPGALEVGVLSFADLIYGEFMSPEERRRFVGGLESVETASMASYGRGFVRLESARQDIVLQAFAEVSQDDGTSFFHQIKELAVVGYFTSEAVARSVLRYDPIPGAFRGCIPVSEVGRTTWVPLR